MEKIMYVTVNLYSEKKGELNKFLSKFYNTNLEIYQDFTWEKQYTNPIEIAEIVGVFLDNIEDYFIHMWICLDKNVYIHINEQNGNEIIKYLYVFSVFPYIFPRVWLWQFLQPDVDGFVNVPALP